MNFDTYFVVVKGDGVGHLVDVVRAAEGNPIADLAHPLEVGVLSQLAEAHGGNLPVVCITVTVLFRRPLLAFALVVSLLVSPAVLAVFIVGLEKGLVREEILLGFLFFADLNFDVAL